MDEDTKKLLSSIIFKYLNPDQVKVFLFGSRAVGNNSKYSDVDLGIESDNDIAYSTILDIEEDFENSDLPYAVDVVDFAKVTDKLKQVVQANKIYLN